MYLINGRLVCHDLLHGPITHILPVELAADSKPNPADFFRNYLQICLDDLPADMPAEYRQQLHCLLLHPPPHDGVADLVYASLNSLGRTVPGSRVTNRQWVWVESLGDIAPSEAPTEGGIRNDVNFSLHGRQVTAYSRKRTHTDSMTPSVGLGRDSDIAHRRAIAVVRGRRYWQGHACEHSCASRHVSHISGLVLPICHIVTVAEPDAAVAHAWVSLAI